MKALLELGARPPESQLWRDSYNVKAFALKTGETDWQATLKIALAAEESESLRREFAKAISQPRQVADSASIR